MSVLSLYKNGKRKKYLIDYEGGLIVGTRVAGALLTTLINMTRLSNKVGWKLHLMVHRFSAYRCLLL